MAHWDALLRPGRVLHVPYERLVVDQEGWSRRMLEHCGLSWDPAVLAFHASGREVMTASLSQARGLPHRSGVMHAQGMGLACLRKARRMTCCAMQVRQKIYTTSVAKWRMYEAQLAPVAEALQPLIAEYEAKWGLQSAHDEL